MSRLTKNIADHISFRRSNAIFPWTAIYSIFVVVGVLIASLLHFAFRKEPKE